MQKFTRANIGDNILERLQTGGTGSVDEHPLPEAALEALNNEQSRLLDAALSLLEAVDDETIDQAVFRNQLPGNLLGPIPNHGSISAIQADKLLGPEFVGALPWNAISVPNNSGGDGQTGSEDTHQVVGGSSRGIRTNATQKTTTEQRPRRQTAQEALKKLTVLEASAIDDDFSFDDIIKGEEGEDFDDNASDDEFGTNGAFQGTSFYPYSQADLRKQSSGKKTLGRSLQQKPYDGLVDPDLPPQEVRRLRRILSNRESARRSRKRKASQVSALEDELAEAKAVAGDLESELVHALKTVHSLETQRGQLLNEVERLRRRLAAYEDQSGAPGIEPIGAATTTAAAAVASPAAVAPRSSAHLQSPLRQLGFQSQVKLIKNKCWLLQ